LTQIYPIKFFLVRFASYKPILLYLGNKCFQKIIAIFLNNRICVNIEGPIGDLELLLQCASSAPGAALVSELARVVSSRSRERFAALTASESQWRTVYIHILLSGADQSGTHHTRQSSRAPLQSARERVFFYLMNSLTLFESIGCERRISKKRSPKQIRASSHTPVM
jgi:hypothetical protein